MVGATRCSAKSENVIRPSRNVGGTFSVSVLAAATAALSRSGWTSVAFIEPEMSVTITTLAARCGAATVRCGRASATISAVSASSSSSGGRWRRQPGRAVVRPGTSAGFAHAADSRCRRRCSEP